MAYSVSDLLDAQPREGEAPYSLHVLERGSEFAPLAGGLEREVFIEAYNLSIAEVNHMFDGYAAASDFVVLVDRTHRELVGSVRVVHWNDNGFPTFVETQKHPEWDRSIVDAYLHHGWDEAPTRILDVASVVVSESHRANGFASVALCHGTYWHSLDLEGVRWVCLLEEAVMDMMVATGLPWERICDLPAAEHEGSIATVPLTVSLTEAAASSMVLGQVGEAASAHRKQLHELVAMPPLVLTKTGHLAPTAS